MRVSKFKIDYCAEIYPYILKKTKQSTPTTTETKCCICYESSEKIKFINCKKGGIQDNIFGKYVFCCKDKAICPNCRSRCRESCPFCRNHTLYNLKTHSFPQKKAPWKEREIKRAKKIAKKLKKIKLEIKKLILKNQRLSEEIEKLKLKQRYINNNLY